MANVQHSSLTGSDLHETKGADTAASGQVPIASGTGTAPFGQLQWTQVGGKPVIVTVYNADVVANTTPLLKTYTVTAVSGVFTAALTGFTTVHNAWATVISGSTTFGSTQVATIGSISNTQVQGLVVTLANPPVAGTTQTVRVTVLGV